MGSDCVELERQGWQALSSSGQEATAFYERVLDREVLMLLPGGMVLDERSSIIEAMAGQPWSSFELEDLRTFQPLPDVCVVAYGAVASREGSADYSALVSSTYVRREDGWRLALHQQIPR